MEIPNRVSSMFLCLLVASPSTSALLLDPHIPLVHAENLIRQLNLFPKMDLNVQSGDHRAGLAGEKRIMEKNLRFPNFEDGSSSVSVDDLGHHAGYYKLDHSHDARLFYFFFESRNSKDDSVVIWLTGGPGCSSELAMFYENGPFSIANNMSLVWNGHGWDTASNLLYVDQPVGTGFSYTSDKRDIRHNEDGVSNDLYDFLQAFFAEHPQFADNDFYSTGESYAGHYIPAFASRVHRGNKAKDGIHINLKGFAIGKGLTDPAVQYKAYTDYALGMGIINQAEYDRINKIVPVCDTAIELCGTDGTLSCVASYFVCNTIFSRIMSLAGETNIGRFSAEMQLSLAASSNTVAFSGSSKLNRYYPFHCSITTSGHNPTVYQYMLVDWMRNLEVGIPILLEDGIKLLVYAGEYDLICNWLGNSRWVHAMKWSGQKEFVDSPEVPFLVDGVEAGVLKSHGPLSFMKVHDAGHMVPMDQPESSLEMLKRWTQGELANCRAGEDDSVNSM